MPCIKYYIKVTITTFCFEVADLRRSVFDCAEMAWAHDPMNGLSASTTVCRLPLHLGCERRARRLSVDANGSPASCEVFATRSPYAMFLDTRGR